MSDLRQAFTATDFSSLGKALDLSDSVAVRARQTLEETRWLLEWAKPLTASARACIFRHTAARIGRLTTGDENPAPKHSRVPTFHQTRIARPAPIPERNPA